MLRRFWHGGERADLARAAEFYGEALDLTPRNSARRVETISAELTVNQPREIALYVRAFDALTRQAVFGPDAVRLITATLRHLQAELPEGRASEPAPRHCEGP